MPLFWNTLTVITITNQVVFFCMILPDDSIVWILTLQKILTIQYYIIVNWITLPMHSMISYWPAKLGCHGNLTHEYCTLSSTLHLYSDTFPEKPQVSECANNQTQTIEWLSAWHTTVLATFLGFRKLLYSCTEGMCHSSTHPGTSLHVTQYYQAFPRVSTVSDKRWGKKALVRG